MAIRADDEAGRIIQEGNESGVLNDAQTRLLMAEVDEDKARNEGWALHAADRHFDSARRIGGETHDEFAALTTEGAALADAIAHGRINPKDGRAALDTLLARKQAAEQRHSTFTTSAESAVTIESDPEAWGRDFLHRYPGARKDYSF